MGRELLLSDLNSMDEMQICTEAAVWGVDLRKRSA
jgi:hypothetical protein